MTMFIERFEVLMGLTPMIGRKDFTMSKKRSLRERLFSIVLAFLTVISSLSLDGLTGWFSREAEAATTTISGSVRLPHDITSTLTANAVRMLGTRYGTPNTETRSTVYDPTNNRYVFSCDTFVSNILKLSGFTLTPANLKWDGWVPLARTGKTDATANGAASVLCYQGQPVTTIVCDTVAEYKAAIDNPAYAGCIITCKELMDYRYAISQGLIREGTIGLGTKIDHRVHAKANTYGNLGESNNVNTVHAVYFLGTYGSRSTGDMWTYARSFYNWFTARYPIGRTLYQLDPNTGTKYLNNANGLYQMTAGYNQATFDTVAPMAYSRPKLLNWSDLTAWVIDSGSDADYSGGGRIASPDGIQRDNDATSNNKQYDAVRLIYLSPTNYYYYGLNAQKFTGNGASNYTGPATAYAATNDGKGLGGGKAKFSVYTTIESDGSLKNPLKLANGTEVVNKEIDTPRGSGATLFSGVNCGTLSKVAFYVEETSSTYGTVNPAVWVITMNGTQSDTTGLGSTIDSFYYYPTKIDAYKKTNGVQILNESGHSGTWFVDGRTAFYEQGTETKLPNAEFVNYVYDQWLTWDLAKTEKGTNTNLANGGYIVIPSSNLGTTNYNGQDRDGAFRWLNNSDSSTNDRRTYSETTQTTYNNPTIAFQSLAKYANDNTTKAADAAKLFVQELGKLRGIDKVSGSYRYLSGSTWYQGQEF